MVVPGAEVEVVPLSHLLGRLFFFLVKGRDCMEAGNEDVFLLLGVSSLVWNEVANVAEVLLLNLRVILHFLWRFRNGVQVHDEMGLSVIDVQLRLRLDWRR